MNELKKTTKQSQELLSFADSKGWSEEELAKVINLLHSKLKENPIETPFIKLILGGKEFSSLS